MLDSPAMKKCSMCKEVKGLDCFWNNARGILGKQSRCKDCSNESAKVYVANKKINATPWAELPTRTCEKCGVEKPSESFNKRGKRSRSKTCYDCALRLRHEYKLAKRINGGTLVHPADKKTCTACMVEKCSSEFHRHIDGPGGIRAVCKDCSCEEARRRRSGWSDEAFEAAWKLQAGRCLICGCQMSRRGWEKNAAAADHDHIKNRPRGILCRKCNSGIGYLRDDPAIVAHALRYLESFE